MLHFSPIRPLRNFSESLESLIRGKLWLQVLLGLGAGIGMGLFLRSDLHSLTAAGTDSLIEWIALPGYIFLRLIKMVMIPLVACSIIRGLGNAPNENSLRSHGSKFAFFVVTTTLVAVFLGILLGTWLKPGNHVTLSSETNNPFSSTEVVEVSEPAFESIPTLLSNIIPANPFSSVLEGDMLAVVIFSLLLGIAFSTQSNNSIRPVFEIINGIIDTLMTIVKWAMHLAPLAVFGLMTQSAAKLGLESLLGMSAFVLTVLLGLLLLIILYVSMVFIIGKTNPITFLKNILPVQLLAFSTSSSAAVMPFSIETAEKKLEVETSAAEFIVPLGTTMNMAGTALYQAITLVFLAQIAGINLEGTQLFLIILTIVASSIGAPGTPGVSLIVLATIAENFGIPAGGLALILGIDRILDMCRTTVNVTGDLTACVLIGKKRKRFFSK